MLGLTEKQDLWQDVLTRLGRYKVVPPELERFLELPLEAQSVVMFGYALNRAYYKLQAYDPATAELYRNTYRKFVVQTEDERNR